MLRCLFYVSFPLPLGLGKIGTCVLTREVGEGGALRGDGRAGANLVDGNQGSAAEGFYEIGFQPWLRQQILG